MNSNGTDKTKRQQQRAETKTQTANYILYWCNLIDICL